VLIEKLHNERNWQGDRRRKDKKRKREGTVSKGKTLRGKRSGISK
jgi:hypothetical protein